MRRCTLVLVAIVGVLSVQQKASEASINVALGATAYQSGTYPGYPASNAVDGRRTFTHTEHPPATLPRWWEVDLGSAMDLTHIDVVTALDNVTVAGRLSGAVVYVKDDSNSTIYTSSPIVDSNVTPVFSYDNSGAGFTGARYIRVEDTTNGDNPYGDYLNLAEVKAWQDQVPSYGNLANIYGTASQSSVYTGGTVFPNTMWGSQNGIDGMDSMVHTLIDGSDNDPSYEVDLGGTYLIDAINLITRWEGSSNLYYNLTFQIFDESNIEVYNSGVIEPWDGVDTGDLTNFAASSSISPTLPIGGVEGSRVVLSKSGYGTYQPNLAFSELEILGNTTPVPEPSSAALLGISVAMGLGARRRRRRFYKRANCDNSVYY